jgi:hypothetical protein
MHRKLKANVVKLAMLATLAGMLLTTTSAEASSESKFTAGTYPTTLSATGSNKEEFTAFGGFTTCSDAEYTGQLTAASAAIEITPVYSGCKGHGLFGSEIPATVTHNGCSFKLHNLQTDGTAKEADYFTVTTDVVCPEGKKIEVHLYTGHNAHTSANSFCTITVGPQTNREGLTIDVNTSKSPVDLTLTGTVSGIKAEFHRNSFLCPHEGTTPTTEDGQYHLPVAGVTVTAKDKEGSGTGIHIG